MSNKNLSPNNKDSPNIIENSLQKYICRSTLGIIYSPVRGYITFTFYADGVTNR